MDTIILGLRLSATLFLNLFSFRASDVIHHSPNDRKDKAEDARHPVRRACFNRGVSRTRNAEDRCVVQSERVRAAYLVMVLACSTDIHQCLALTVSEDTPIEAAATALLTFSDQSVLMVDLSRLVLVDLGNREHTEQGYRTQ
ncbi:hypothetical protein VPHK356_0122 [Vibrio phage K356]